MATTIIGSEVRTDLQEVHAAFVAALGTPGNWWNAAERLEIAAEVRRATADRGTAPWAGPDGMASIIWRLTNHPGTLTGDWYESAVAARRGSRRVRSRRRTTSLRTRSPGT